jgi:hypothetical protein
MVTRIASAARERQRASAPSPAAHSARPTTAHRLGGGSASAVAWNHSESTMSFMSQISHIVLAFGAAQVMACL